MKVHNNCEIAAGGFAKLLITIRGFRSTLNDSRKQYSSNLSDSRSKLLLVVKRARTREKKAKIVERWGCKQEMPHSLVRDSWENKREKWVCENDIKKKKEVSFVEYPFQKRREVERASNEER